MKKLIRIASCVLAVTATSAFAEDSASLTSSHDIVKSNIAKSLVSAVNSSFREKDKARDKYRNPAETLAFFGLKPDMTVVEVWPGGGWYTRVLAPTLNNDGKLIAAHVDPTIREYYAKSRKRFEEKVASIPEFKNIEVTTFHPLKSHKIAEEGSADMVLTFRNLHNWYMQSEDEGVKDSFKTFYKTLKPGGVLGVVDHRMPENKDQKANKRSGYLKQSYVVKMAEAAGFELEASSEINANPKDTADHPKGVWSLPPRLAGDKKDQEKYRAVGESDRMTLKFRKPKK